MTRLNRLVLAVSLALAIGATAQPVTAQSPDQAPPPPNDTVAIAADPLRPRNEGRLWLAGAGGLIAGALGGGLIGIQIDDDKDLDTAEGAVVGGVIGTSLAVPTAVHLVNGRRGNLGRSMLVSTLVGGAVFGLGWAAESGVIILAAPLAQLITSVVIERKTSR